ncbi:MAG: bifunctional 23S rRNA (guanine(2069)-N(7))-methyltransferase RlmK/23S rRNA (guanine(2445)-N(2))-methyltransferase RlmL [Gammaproteobacteria bacterium]|nr:bifunctional 23S rRNA (guanine(2069)-N(7))-methyltransferase RlmK/23S rRNA (guanine(2445)-N(2))-methyltransferase RlmL [Gammaproteobacteria bacterium]
MNNNLTFFATCPKGMDDLLASELKQLGANDIKPAVAGVGFTAELAVAYRICLWSRLASRILLQLGEFAAADDAQLYQGVQGIDWHEHLNVDGTLAVSCQLNKCSMTNSHYATLKIKDAIVDQFSERFNQRPWVDRDQPDIRVHVYIERDVARISLDLSGESSHRRGYRSGQVAAPMKENLAVAVLLRAGWPNESRTLVDLMCGSGTLLTEAAMMALNIAPGLERDYFGFLKWKQHDAASWQQVRQEAQAIRKQAKQETSLSITGYDQSADAVAAARKNIHAADLDNFITVEQRAVSECADPQTPQTGLVVMNPPYGERLGDVRQLAYLYAELGDCWKQHFAGWNVALLTGNHELAKQVGLRAHKINTLYNGAIECGLFHYHINEKPADDVVSPAQEKADEARTAFINRLKKNHKHFSRWAQRNAIECYRVYDADIPEYAVAIDIYGDWLHVQEYAPPATVDIRMAQRRMRQVMQAVPETLGVDTSHIVFKTRQQQKGTSQYEKQDDVHHRIMVHEAGLKFYVNLEDYLDTGLFLDHRLTRAMIRDLSRDKRVLNLFAYTGTASVYAVEGGARSVTTLDMSRTYLDWAESNFRLNDMPVTRHPFIQADCIYWLSEQQAGPHYDVIFLDPPTFSNSKRMADVLDIQRDHVSLIESCMAILSDQGVLVFSNNFRRFKLEAAVSNAFAVEEISARTLPEDFKRNPKIHRCWLIRKK